VLHKICRDPVAFGIITVFFMVLSVVSVSRSQESWQKNQSMENERITYQGLRTFSTRAPVFREMSVGNDLQLQNPVVENPWELLQGCTLILKSFTRVAEHYVTAQCRNSGNGLGAVVFFHVTCSSEGCALNSRAAYVAFDEQGQILRTYVDPREHELMTLISVQMALR
jgi:hypothetical protein